MNEAQKAEMLKKRKGMEGKQRPTVSRDIMGTGFGTGGGGLTKSLGGLSSMTETKQPTNPTLERIMNSKKKDRSNPMKNEPENSEPESDSQTGQPSQPPVSSVSQEEIPTPDEIYGEDEAGEEGESGAKETMPDDELSESEQAAGMTLEEAAQLPKRLSYKKPDGTTGYKDLPSDPQARLRYLGSLATAQDALMNLKEGIVEEYPELQKDLRRIIQENTEAIKAVRETVKPKAPPEEEPSLPRWDELFTTQDKADYDAMVEDYGQEHADRVWRAVGVTRVKQWELENKYKEVESYLVRDKSESLFMNQLKKIHALDPSLPDPVEELNAFKEKFTKGYGKFLGGLNFTDEQFAKGLIDHKRFYKWYKEEEKSGNTENNQSPKPEKVEQKEKAPTEKSVPKKIDAKTAEAIKNMSSGSSGAAIGGDMDWQSLRALPRKQKLEKVRKDPSIEKRLIDSLGISGWIRQPKRK